MLVFPLYMMDLRRLRDKRNVILDEVLVRQLSAHMLEGTQRLHDAQVIHRDLNPPNMMVDISNGNVVLKIAGFGSSKVRDDISNMSVLTSGVATSWRWAPEMSTPQEGARGNKRKMRKGGPDSTAKKTRAVCEFVLRLFFALLPATPSGSAVGRKLCAQSRPYSSCLFLAF